MERLNEIPANKYDINPSASPSAGAPSLKYRYINTETSSPGEAKGLIIIIK